MKRFGYFEKLSLAARWFLPREEAAEVLADYREILSEIGEDQAKENFGSPVKVVFHLMERSKTIVWHVFFIAALIFHFYLFHWAKHNTFYTIAALAMSAVAAGLLLGLLGVGKLRNPFRGLPKSIFILFIVLIAFIITMFTPAYYLLRFYNNPYPWYYDQRFHSFLYGSVVLSTLLSVVGIILARIKDRRWRAVSILSLTITCVAFYFLEIFQNSPSSDPVVDVVLLNHEGIFVGAAGILAAVAGLC